MILKIIFRLFVCIINCKKKKKKKKKKLNMLKQF